MPASNPAPGPSPKHWGGVTRWAGLPEYRRTRLSDLVYICRSDNMHKHFDSRAYVKQVGVDLVTAFRSARTGTTSTLVGRAMENATLKKLDQLLPRALAAGSGCVIDSEGRTSHQMDIVIYERNLCPVFCINASPETTYYPCEGVVAVGEIKSKVGKSEFDDTVKKMESVKTLKRKFTLYPEEDENAGCLRSSRQYGQMANDGITFVEKHTDPRVDVECDILTFLLTESFKVQDKTVKTYYQPLRPETHDVLIGLDGLQVFGARKQSEDTWVFTTMRLAETIAMLRTQDSFAYLIRRLYEWFRIGKTAELGVFEDYLLKVEAMTGADLL